MFNTYRKQLAAILVAAAMSIFMMSFLMVPVIHAEKKVIDIPHWWWEEPGNDRWLNYVTDIFEKENPDYRVHGYVVPYDEYPDKMATQVAAGNPPDLIYLHGAAELPTFAAEGSLIPLDDWLATTDIVESLVYGQKWGKYKGQTYGLLIFNTTREFLYNVKMFEEAGLPPRPPKSVDEMIEFGRKLTEPPKQWGYSNTCRPGNVSKRFLYVGYWLAGRGASLTKDGKISFNDPKVVQGIKDYARIVHSEIAPEGMSLNLAREMFWQGKAAMRAEGPWEFMLVEEDVLPHIRSAHLPTETKAGLSTAGGFWCIPKDADCPEGAKKWLEVMYRPEVHVKRLDWTTTLPTVDVFHLRPNYLEENPRMEPFVESLQEGNMAAFTFEGLELHAIELKKMFVDAIEEILYQEAPIEQTLDDLQQRAESFLKKQG